MKKGAEVLEKTLVIIKPDAVKRGLVGAILTAYESKGLKIIKMKFGIPQMNLLKRHYSEHEGKAFYDKLLTFMQSGEAVFMVLAGEKAIETVRYVNGATHYLEAENGSIRGQYAFDLTENLVHGSDGPVSAKREIEIWFGPESSGEEVNA